LASHLGKTTLPRFQLRKHAEIVLKIETTRKGNEAAALQWYDARLQAIKEADGECP
jgi:hypothetical protein